MKSSLVEEAANELINMLLEIEQKVEEDESKGTNENRAESTDAPACGGGKSVNH